MVDMVDMVMLDKGVTVHTVLNSPCRLYPVLYHKLSI